MRRRENEFVVQVFDNKREWVSKNKREWVYVRVIHGEIYIYSIVESYIVQCVGLRLLSIILGSPYPYPKFDPEKQISGAFGYRSG